MDGFYAFLIDLDILGCICHSVKVKGCETFISDELFNVHSIIRDGVKWLNTPPEYGEVDALKRFFLAWSSLWESWVPRVFCGWVGEEWMSEGWIMQVRIPLFGEGPLQHRRLCEILIHHLKVVVWILPRPLGCERRDPGVFTFSFSGWAEDLREPKSHSPAYVSKVWF